jgi:hypothetical protein
MRKRVGLAVLSAMVFAGWVSVIPALGYESGTVSGGGSIEGRIIYNGPVETRKIIPNKDVETCGGIREESLIQVGPDRAVENAVVYLQMRIRAPCSGDTGG